MKYGKYIVEAIFVFLGILLSFYIDDIRVKNENTKFKNELVRDLQEIIENEKTQIKNIKELQFKCLNAAEELIFDIRNDSKLSDKKIAENFLLVSQRGTVSFFPQRGIYEEFINTGSTKLIKSKNFRYALSDTYNNLNDRNLAVSRIIDDFFFRELSNVNENILVISKEVKNDSGYVYSDLVPVYFKIEKNYYESDEFLSIINQFKSLIERYIDMLDKLESSYNLLDIYTEEELSD
tara:strand:+ start:1604 stop:2311 length:708 start_codon:yes stop_codon:yes gene_type:complete